MNTGVSRSKNFGVGEYPSGTFRFKKIDGSFWNGETFRFADYISEDLCEAMLDSLKSHYPNCRRAGKLPLPRSTYYSLRQRYLADSLVAYLENRHTKDNIVVGLTAVDISLCNFRGHDNYGIMGLTNRIGGGVCVFSNYRKKSKDGMFQLMRHELGHAVGLRHCKTADCLMHDAEGKDLKGGTFCQTCDLFLTKKGWR